MIRVEGEERSGGEGERERWRRKAAWTRDLSLSALRTFFGNGGRGSSSVAKQLLAVRRNDNEMTNVAAAVKKSDT